MRGITIADLVQQVFYNVYGVRLDVTSTYGNPSAYHSHSEKFKEIVQEANQVIESIQKDQDWNWLRERWDMGHAHPGIQEFHLPDTVYKPCTGYGDAVRLHTHNRVIQIPWVEPRMGNKFQRRMYDPVTGEYNTVNYENYAFRVGNDICFKRPFKGRELGGHLETDVIRQLEPLHICGPDCPHDAETGVFEQCPEAYEKQVLTEHADLARYVVLQTAAHRAEFDPDTQDRAQSLTDRAKQFLSSMREEDSAHTMTEYWDTEPLGFIEVI